MPAAIPHMSHSPATPDAPAHVAERPADRAPRLTTILLGGRALVGTRDYLCRIRNVSVSGMMIECSVPVPVGTPLRIEVRSRTIIDAEVVWTDAPRIGLRSVEPIDIPVMLDLHRREGGRMPRSPRLTTATPVRLTQDGHSRNAVLLDISQAGCRIAITGLAESSAPVRIDVPGLAPRHAARRWVGDHDAGFTFLEPYGFADLAAWQTDGDRRFVLGDRDGIIRKDDPAIV